MAFVVGDYNRAQETIVTIYLLEILGLGLMLFLVAMVKSALERTQSRPGVEPQQKTTAK